MQRHKIFTHSLIASVALFSLSQAPKASAETTWVQRGPHGAIQIVEGDRPPIGTTALPTSTAHSSPKLVVRGSHGAFQLANDQAGMTPKMSEVPAPAHKMDRMKLQSTMPQSMTNFNSAQKLNAEELLKITNPLI